MAWVIWRQHRLALAGVAVFLGALAVCCGSPAFSCTTRTPPRSPATRRARLPAQNLIVNFQSTNVILKGGFVLQAVPALIGAFVGAPVLARELETGTFRYAWTQGFGRWRWTLAKLVALGVAVAAARRSLQRAGLLVLPAVLRRGQRAVFSSTVPALSRAVRPARGRVRRLDAGRLRDRRPGRHAHSPGRPRDRRHPRRLRRARLGCRERACASTTWHRWSRKARTFPVPRGS